MNYPGGEAFEAKHEAEKQQLEKARRDEGRYTFEEAASAICSAENQNSALVLVSLYDAAGKSRVLKIYLPGSKISFKFEQQNFPDVDFYLEHWKFICEIYWHELNAWLKEFMPLVEFEFPNPIDSEGGQQNVRPLQRQLSQEQEIMRVIRELKYEPTMLPKAKPGTSGVKAAVRDKLNFAPGVFNKAWERLRAQEEIKNAN